MKPMEIEYVTKKHFCAGFFGKGGGACNRDAGGPGVVGDTLVGVISFGTPLCGAPDSPTVFTKVGYYIDWIDEIMEQRVPHRKSRTTLSTRYTPRFFYPLPTTTFKIPPLGAKIRSRPISEVDTLRQQKQQELFRDFIAAIFGSKEIGAFRELYSEPSETPLITNRQKKVRTTQKKKEVKKKNEHHRTKTVKTTPMYVHPHTIMEQVDLVEYIKSEEGFTEMPYVMPKKSKTNKKIQNNIEFNNDLIELVDKIDIRHLLGNLSTVDDENMAIKTDNTQLLQYFKDKKDVEPLYLVMSNSDESKTVEDSADSDETGTSEIDEGLSIPLEPFKDLTQRSKNQSTIEDFFRFEELYDLLSELTGNNSLTITERK